jgi:hypothetical protein
MAEWTSTNVAYTQTDNTKINRLTREKRGCESVIGIFANFCSPFHETNHFRERAFQRRGWPEWQLRVWARAAAVRPMIRAEPAVTVGRRHATEFTACSGVQRRTNCTALVSCLRPSAHVQLIPHAHRCPGRGAFSISRRSSPCTLV